jgi:plasmid stabilization system protein ParE
MHPDLAPLRVFPVSGFEKMLVLRLPLPNGIEILRVLHGSRNLRTLLRREGVD